MDDEIGPGPNNPLRIIKAFYSIAIPLLALLYFAYINSAQDLEIKVEEKYSRSSTSSIGARVPSPDYYYVVFEDKSLTTSKEIYYNLEVESIYSASVIGWETLISNRRIIEIKYN